MKKNWYSLPAILEELLTVTLYKLVGLCSKLSAPPAVPAQQFVKVRFEPLVVELNTNKAPARQAAPAEQLVKCVDNNRAVPDWT